MSVKSFSNSQQLVVFIGSTFLDLRAHRGKIEELLNRIEGSFRSMKFFGSKEGDPLEQCLRKLQACNYYVAVIGYRRDCFRRQTVFSDPDFISIVWLSIRSD